jgi:hypothetical protein
MVEDSMSMMDPDELEGEADEEVEKVRLDAVCTA